MLIIFTPQTIKLIKNNKKWKILIGKQKESNTI